MIIIVSYNQNLQEREHGITDPGIFDGTAELYLYPMLQNIQAYCPGAMVED